MTSDTRPPIPSVGFASFFRGVCIACLLLSPLSGHAQTFIPSDDSTVIDELPSAVIKLSQQLRQQRQVNVSNRTAEDLLQEAARSYRIATADSSPRAYGRTLAILRGWPQALEQPPGYHVLMAAVLQHNHEFTLAIEHLDQALAMEPDNAQALLIKAQIGMVTGEHAMARDNCNTLRSLVHPSLHLNCQAQLDGVTGNAAPALAALEQSLDNGRPPAGANRVELLLSAAVIAHRLGLSDHARQRYLEVLQQTPRNVYALTRFGDLLLETGLAGQLVTLLDAYPAESLNTELRILLAEALQAIGSSEASARARVLTDTLEQEFSIALMRGEALPHKTYARFSLNLLERPGQALAAAKENWTLQREPSDTLLLARAALAAEDQETLEQVRQWVSNTGLESRQLDSVLQQAEGQMP